MKFTITYPKKISEYGLNAIYAGKHWSKRKKDGEYWHWLVMSELSRQRIRRKIFKNPVKIVMYWNDRMDIDNHAYMGKMIVDSLKGHLIVDDTRKYFKGVSHEFWDGKEILVEIKEI